MFIPSCLGSAIEVWGVHLTLQLGAFNECFIGLRRRFMLLFWIIGASAIPWPRSALLLFRGWPLVFSFPPLAIEVFTLAVGII